MEKDFVIEGTILKKYIGKDENVVIPDGVTKIGEKAFYNYAFFDDAIPDSGNCAAIKSVIIPDSVNYIGSEAFYNCSGLKKIDIPDSVETIGCRTFYGCSGLTEITIPNSVEWFAYDSLENCENLENVYYGGGESADAYMAIEAILIGKNKK